MNAVIALDPTDSVLAEMDAARRRGPLQHIVIPPCPELLSRLQQVMAQPEPDLNEVARIATSDVAMSAALIRSANSALFAAGQPAQTIGQAMNRLGLQHTARAMTSFMTEKAVRVPNSPHLQRFWERAAKRATAMVCMAERLPGVSPDLAHTYGLFCHVGLVVMAQSVRGYLSTLVEARARIDRSFVATENANHRTDHAVVGALTARVWRLAPPVVAAIRLHHDLETLREQSAQSEVSTLIAMGLIAEWLRRRHEGLDPDVDWHEHGAVAMDWLHIGQDDMMAWEDELRPYLDAV